MLGLSETALFDTFRECVISDRDRRIPLDQPDLAEARNADMPTWKMRRLIARRPLGALLRTPDGISPVLKLLKEMPEVRMDRMENKRHLELLVLLCKVHSVKLCRLLIVHPLTCTLHSSSSAV